MRILLYLNVRSCMHARVNTAGAPRGLRRRDPRSTGPNPGSGMGHRRIRPRIIIIIIIIVVGCCVGHGSIGQRSQGLSRTVLLRKVQNHLHDSNGTGLLATTHGELPARTHVVSRVLRERVHIVDMVLPLSLWSHATRHEATPSSERRCSI
jgi:hypothetical protein